MVSRNTKTQRVVFHSQGKVAGSGIDISVTRERRWLLNIYGQDSDKDMRPEGSGPVAKLWESHLAQDLYVEVAENAPRPLGFRNSQQPLDPRPTNFAQCCIQTPTPTDMAASVQ